MKNKEVIKFKEEIKQAIVIREVENSFFNTIWTR